MAQYPLPVPQRCKLFYWSVEALACSPSQPAAQPATHQPSQPATQHTGQHLRAIYPLQERILFASPMKEASLEQLVKGLALYHLDCHKVVVGL